MEEGSAENYVVTHNESHTTTSYPGLDFFMVLSDTEKRAIGSICFLAGPFTLLENVVVLVVIVTSASLRRRPSYLFIGSLALADIFASCFFTISFLDFHLFDRHDSPNTYLFKLGGVTMAFTGSVGSLLLTALDRYICIHRASRYKVLLTRRRALRWLLVLWCSTLIISFLPLLGWRCPTDLKPPCSHLFPYIDHRYMVCWTSFILALISLIICAYALILWRAHKHEASMSGLQQEGQARMRMDIRLARTLALILLILVGCWVPTISFMLVDATVSLTRHQQRAFAFISTLCLVYSAVNPLLYALRCYELRVALVRLLRRLVGLLCCQKLPGGETVSATSENNSCSIPPKVEVTETTACQLTSVSERVDKQQLDIK